MAVGLIGHQGNITVYKSNLMIEKKDDQPHSSALIVAHSTARISQLLCGTFRHLSSLCNRNKGNPQLFYEHMKKDCTNNSYFSRFGIACTFLCTLSIRLTNCSFSCSILRKSFLMSATIRVSPRTSTTCLCTSWNIWDIYYKNMFSSCFHLVMVELTFFREQAWGWYYSR